MWRFWVVTLCVSCYLLFKWSNGISAHCWQFAVFLQNAVFIGNLKLRRFVRDIREGLFCEHYEMKWSNEWSPSGGQGRWIAAEYWFYRGFGLCEVSWFIRIGI